MKLLARIKQWNKSNAGLTLVEIIVTMLILVVIALPILGGFIIAGRANARARDLAYARDAAENVVEVINSSGVSEEVFKELKKDHYWGNYTLKVDPTDENKFSYTIENVRAGTGTYTAVIECNKSTYYDASNYTFPDMSALDSEKTVVIFPESNFYKFDDEGNLDATSDLHRFDTTAINDFYSDYHDGVLDIYSAVVYAAYLEKVVEIEEYNKKVVSPDPTLAPPVFPQSPDEFRSADSGDDAVKNYIHRTIDIKVEYSKNTETGGDDNVQATVSTKYVYVMKDGLGSVGPLTDMIGTSFDMYRTTEDRNGNGVPDNEDYSYIDFSEGSALKSAIADLVSSLKESKEYTVAADSTVDLLDNIYLITYPFNAAQAQMDAYNTLNLTAEFKEADIEYVDKSVDVFLTIQEEAGGYKPESTDLIYVTIKSPLKQDLFKLHSQITLTGIAPELKSNTLFSDKENSSGNMLLDVTVKIYEPGNVNNGKELTGVKTTISSKK